MLRSGNFFLRGTGEYSIKVMWNGVPLPKCPLIGIAGGSASGGGSTTEVLGMAIRPSNQQAGYQGYSHMQTTSTTQSHAARDTVDGRSQTMMTTNLDKVVLTGMGLRQATVGQEADFEINGTNAGLGMSGCAAV